MPEAKETKAPEEVDTIGVKTSEDFTYSKNRTPSQEAYIQRQIEISERKLRARDAEAEGAAMKAAVAKAKEEEQNPAETRGRKKG